MVVRCLCLELSTPPCVSRWLTRTITAPCTIHRGVDNKIVCFRKLVSDAVEFSRQRSGGDESVSGTGDTSSSGIAQGGAEEGRSDGSKGSGKGAKKAGKKKQGNSLYRWIFSSKKRPHTHEITSLVTVPLAGGEVSVLLSPCHSSASAFFLFGPPPLFCVQTVRQPV